MPTLLRPLLSGFCSGCPLPTGKERDGTFGERPLPYIPGSTGWLTCSIQAWGKWYSLHFSDAGSAAQRGWHLLQVIDLVSSKARTDPKAHTLFSTPAAYDGGMQIGKSSWKSNICYLSPPHQHALTLQHFPKKYSATVRSFSKRPSYILLIQAMKKYLPPIKYWRYRM